MADDFKCILVTSGKVSKLSPIMLMILSKGFLKWLKYTQIENGPFFLASGVVVEWIAERTWKHRWKTVKMTKMFPKAWNFNF